jgi:nucleotide-binding universal stress UspA family protein
MDAPPIVVGFHDRTHSREALTWAADEATWRGLPLLVLYAANYPGMSVPEGAHFETDSGALEAANELTARGVAQAVTEHPGIAVSGRTEVTSPARALVEASARAALLVVGSRGRGPVLGTLLGSISLVVSARAKCPVVVVKPGCATTRPGPEHRVVVGTDGSAPAAEAVAFAAEFASGRSTELEIICCAGEAPPGGGANPEDVRRGVDEILTAAARSVKEIDPNLTVITTAEDGLAEDTLVAASEDAGLTVVGSRGRGAFKGMIAGSVSMAVTHGALCPVAVTNSPETERERGSREENQ